MMHVCFSVINRLNMKFSMETMMNSYYVARYIHLLAGIYTLKFGHCQFSDCRSLDESQDWPDASKSKRKNCSAPKLIEQLLIRPVRPKLPCCKSYHASQDILTTWTGPSHIRTCAVVPPRPATKVVSWCWCLQRRTLGMLGKNQESVSDSSKTREDQ